MPRPGTTYFMYHELGIPRRPLCGDGKGYARYVVSLREFEAQLTLLCRMGMKGMSVSGALAEPDGGQRGVVLTFDDGCETDLINAAPVLRQAGFNATFYVVVGWLGRPGFLSPGQVRELCDMGFEVGCHSMSHALLNNIAQDRLYVEIAEAKDQLEQLIGQRINHFSCPGGRWSRSVARIAQEAGYLSVATSRVGTNSSNADPYCLCRVAVLRMTSLSYFERLCRGEGLLCRRARYQMLSLGKTLLGNSVYEEVRSALFGHTRGY